MSNITFVLSFICSFLVCELIYNSRVYANFKVLNPFLLVFNFIMVLLFGLLLLYFLENFGLMSLDEKIHQSSF